MVGDCYESLLACLIFRSRLDEVKKSGKAVDFCCVKAEEEQSGQGRDEEDCLVRGRSPEEAWDFGVVIEVITAGHCRRPIAAHAMKRRLCALCL